MQHIINLFFKSNTNNFLEKYDFLIIDVRSMEAYETDHIEHSLNIPLHQLNNKILKSNFIKFRKKSFLLVCSESEHDNETAKNILESHGCEYVSNGGNWKTLQQKVNGL